MTYIYFKIIVRNRGYKSRERDDWTLGYELESRLDAMAKARQCQKWNPWQEITIARGYRLFDDSQMRAPRVPTYPIRRPHQERQAPRLDFRKPVVYERYGIPPGDKSLR